MTTGMARVSSSALMRRQTSKPSMRGRLRSRTIRSGRRCFTASSASGPSRATLTSWPRASRNFETSLMSSGSSSTTRMLAMSALVDERADALEGPLGAPATAVHKVVADVALAIDEVGLGPLLGAVAARDLADRVVLVGRVEQDGQVGALGEELAHRRPGRL